jgi:hypothetical protein
MPKERAPMTNNRATNNSHALDGGIALQFHIAHHLSAASDVIR